MYRLIFYQEKKKNSQKKNEPIGMVECKDVTEIIQSFNELLQPFKIFSVLEVNIDE